MMPLWETLARERVSAEALLSRLQITKVPVPIGRMVNTLGINLYRADTGGIQAVLEVDRAASQASIVVDDKDPATVQRFATATALAVLMTRPAMRRTCIRTGEDCRADRYAAALLAPPWMMRSGAPALAFNADALADAFWVPRATMVGVLHKMYGEVWR